MGLVRVILGDAPSLPAALPCSLSHEATPAVLGEIQVGQAQAPATDLSAVLWAPVLYGRNSGQQGPVTEQGDTFAQVAAEAPPEDDSWASVRPPWLGHLHTLSGACIWVRQTLQSRLFRRGPRCTKAIGHVKC